MQKFAETFANFSQFDKFWEHLFDFILHVRAA